MALHNVTVSCTSFIQNLSPYTGSIRFRLNHPVVIDEELIVPQWQMVTFDSSTGTADVSLVPNALLGADTCYQFEVYQTASATVKRNALVERGSMYVPDGDCNLLDIAVIKSGKETAGMAEGYASECKQIYADTSALVTGFTEQVETASKRITTEKNAAIGEVAKSATIAATYASEAASSAEEAEAYAKDVKDAVEQHNTSPDAHEDIRALIPEEVSSHNTSATAHEDIRKLITDLQNALSDLSRKVVYADQESNSNTSTTQGE